MTPTPLDVRAFAAHVTDAAVRCRCGAGNLQLNRIVVLHDAAASVHIGAPDAADDEQATPVAVVMCRACYALQLFAWLPIVEAFDRAVTESLVALANIDASVLAEDGMSC